MPVLWILALKCLLLYLFFELVQESVFSSHAEVTDSEEAHFLKDKFSGKFKLDRRLA